MLMVTPAVSLMIKSTQKEMVMVYNVTSSLELKPF